ncbi:universal stress protein [Microbulbifer variabilis]|uniref:universal stress protein n=1 Tax=Microbulbifer variabilis TaxID=266805 RepID=UPI001CFD64B0|nr:universal stress protein [Microbulbifer variabilis]
MAFKNILLPLDGSAIAEEAIAHAMKIAKACDAVIHLLHVQKSQSQVGEQSIDPVDWRMRQIELKSYLNQQAEEISKSEISVSLSVVEGRPAEKIVEYCENSNIDLIVFTAFGHGGPSRFDFGSTAHKVFSGAGCSFMVVRPGMAPVIPEKITYHRILILMDGSPRSEWVACHVASLMRMQEEDVELILLQVIAIPDMPRRMPITREEHATREKFVECNRRAAEVYLEEVARQLENGIKVRPLLLVAQNVSECISTTAAKENVDLIAMSAYDWQTGKHQVTGTICHTVMSHSNLPVLVFQDLQEPKSQSLGADSDTCQIRYATHPVRNEAHR